MLREMKQVHWSNFMEELPSTEQRFEKEAEMFGVTSSAILFDIVWRLQQSVAGPLITTIVENNLTMFWKQ